MIDGIRPPTRRPPANFPNRNIPPGPSAPTSRYSDQFKPPETVAKEEEQQAIKSTVGKLIPAKASKIHRLKNWWAAKSKRQKILLSAIAVLILGGAGFGLYYFFFSNPNYGPFPVIQNQEEDPPKPTTVASNLTGLQVDPSVNDRPVTAIMIENSTDARPQAGVDQAGVVFEAIAEGGITRFLTLFQDNEPDYIGPVRSVRPYYLQWALGFDAPIAHAGGSNEALDSINKWKVKDLNHASDYFWRVSNRAAPHNLYTSIAKLHEYEAKKGFGKSNFTSLVRKADAPSATPAAKTVDFNISSANFNTHYEYDSVVNSYKRSVGGQPHTDDKSGAQLMPKVLVALVMTQGKNGVYTTYGTIGSGQAYVFQDGNVTMGSWKKESNNANFALTDSAGAPLTLNAGQTWFTIVGGTDRITYSP